MTRTLTALALSVQILGSLLLQCLVLQRRQAHIPPQHLPSIFDIGYQLNLYPIAPRTTQPGTERSGRGPNTAPVGPSPSVVEKALPALPSTCWTHANVFMPFGAYSTRPSSWPRYSSTPLFLSPGSPEAVRGVAGFCQEVLFCTIATLPATVRQCWTNASDKGNNVPSSPASQTATLGSRKHRAEFQRFVEVNVTPRVVAQEMKFVREGSREGGVLAMQELSAVCAATSITNAETTIAVAVTPPTPPPQRLVVSKPAPSPRPTRLREENAA